MFQGLKLQVTKKHSVQILYDQHRFTQLPWDTVGDFEPKEHMFEKHMAKCKHPGKTVAGYQLYSP